MSGPPVSSESLLTSPEAQLLMGLLLLLTVATVLGRRRRYPAPIVVLVIVLVFASALIVFGLPAAAVTALVLGAATVSIRLSFRPPAS